MATATPEPYRVEVPESDLIDLRRRIRDARWPDAETVDDWSQGVPLRYLRAVCEYWADSYDWRRLETRLNGLPQFRCHVDGVDIHFLHVRSVEPDAIPMVVTHGWPGSIVEFLDVVDPLVDPVAHGGARSDAFHLVIPSLPGFGFSGKPTTTGWNRERVADAWAQMMSMLGYSRFVAQGGDWGASVANQLAVRHPDRLLGIHVNLVSIGPSPEDGVPTDEAPGSAGLPADEAAAIAEWERVDEHHRRWEVGYMHQQRTRPQTLGYGLHDSPVGQCAWILEKFKAWSDCGDDPVAGFGIDRLLDNITLYWLSGTATSSARFYWECQPAGFSTSVHVPAGATIFPREIRRPHRRWAERVYRDLRYWSEALHGGHFAAMERPATFVDEIRAYRRTLRSTELDT